MKGQRQSSYGDGKVYSQTADVGGRGVKIRSEAFFPEGKPGHAPEEDISPVLEEGGLKGFFRGLFMRKES